MTLSDKFIDHEAEKQVLGAALRGSIAEDVTDDDFHLHRHRDLWKLVRRLEAERKPVTVETVLAGSMTEGQVYGELAYLTELVSISSTISAPQYADRISDLARRRGILEALHKAARGLLDGTVIEEVVAEIQADVLRYTGFKRRADKLTLSRIVDGFLEAYAEPRDVWGLKTGIRALDHELGGLHKGEVLLVAGDPGIGKSIFTTQLGFQMAGVEFWKDQIVGKAPGAMYHLEMSAEAVTRRAICAKARVKYKSVRTGKVEDAERERFMEAVAAIEYAPVYVSDDTEWTTATLRADIARLMDEKGIEWVLVDYAGLLKDPAESEIAREIKISKALHDIAKMGVAMVAVETMNKAGLRGERGLSGVRGSIQKTYDADVVVMLQLPSEGTYPGSMERELKFVKAREADMFLKIPLILNGGQKRFEPKPPKGMFP